MDRQSTRGFLAMVERQYSDELVRVSAPVKRELDIPRQCSGERAGRSPVVIFDNVEGFDMPVVTNIAGNRQLIAAAMGVEPSALAATFRERCQNYRPVERVASAPWQELVIEGDAVDLTRLPIPTHFAVDAGPYITAGQICARDPQTGVDTTRFHRLMLKGRNRLGVSLHSRRRMYEYHRRAEAHGEPLPAVVTPGIHPIHYIGSMVNAYAGQRAADAGPCGCGNHRRSAHRAALGGPVVDQGEFFGGRGGRQLDGKGSPALTRPALIAFRRACQSRSVWSA
jgi:2,5-furandicarboxylate decarboxylase 1